MEPLPESDLEPAYRFALAYAPQRSRAVIRALFALDTRLGRVGLQASEPMIAQLRLAWWRDQFAKPVGEWPVGEPLLQSLKSSSLDGASLSALVDGWEAVTVAEDYAADDIAALGKARGEAWKAVAHALDESDAAEAAEACGMHWTLGEWIEGLEEDVEASPSDRGLPRTLRPFAILDRLGQRAIRKRRPVLDGAGALAIAMRVGIFGR